MNRDQEPQLFKRLKASTYPRFTLADAQLDICFEMQNGVSYRGKYLTCVATDDDEKPFFVLMVRTNPISSYWIAFDDPSLKRWWWPDLAQAAS